jgi:hypothetical protein
MAFIFAVLFFLFNGINIKSFSFGEIYISQLYIKLDKKLIVDIDTIKLNRDSNASSSYEDLKSNVAKLPTVLRFFQKIDIETLEIQGNIFKILLDEDLLYLDNKLINFSSKYSVQGNTIALDLYSLYLKDLDLLLEGKLKLDYYKDIASFFGKYLYEEQIEGELNTQFTKEFIDFYVTTGKIKNIRFLKKLFRLDPIAEDWMYKNVTGDMKLNFLYGKINTQTLQPVLNSIEGDASIKNAHITFNEKVDPVITPNLHVTYKKDTLGFELEKPMFKNLSIEGSSVNIPHLTSLEKGRVDVKIKHKGQLNEDVLAILKAYDIPLPLKQLSGVTDAYVYLKIPYVNPMETFGNFRAKDANFTIGSFPFYSKEATVELKNDDVIITSSDFKHKDMLDSTVDLVINTKRLDAKGNALINAFEIKDKQNSVVKINDLKTPLSMEFKKQSTIYIQALDVNIDLKKDATYVNIPDLNKIHAYSKVLQDIGVKKGNINLIIIDNNTIDFSGFVDGLDLPIQKNEEPITSLHLTGQIRDKELRIVSKEEDILIEANEDLLVTLKDLQVVSSDNLNFSNEEQKPLKVRLLNSVIIDKQERYFAQDAFLQLQKDRLTFDGIFSGLDLPLSKKGKKITSLDAKGYIQKDEVKLVSKSKEVELLYRPITKSMEVNLHNMDVLYRVDKNVDGIESLKINGTNSNIIINDKFKVLASTVVFVSDKQQTRFDLTHNKTTMSYSKDENNNILIKANKVSDTFINTFFDRDFISGGTLNVQASGKDDMINGVMKFNNNRVKNLAILNNLIILVNTSPALINPFLAIPAVFGMVTNEGFNLAGYKVVKGKVEFVYNKQKQYLNMHKIFTKGSSVDFDGFATFDFDKNLINSDIKMIFFKDYTKVVDYIPGLNYILLGKDKRIGTLVNIRGKIDKPDIKTNLLKDSANVPLDILKRIFTLPFQPFMSDDKKEEPKKPTQESNK